MKSIVIYDVEKKYKENKVLKGVSLECDSGTITGIIGRNGSGKTVLLKIICGLIVPDSGDVIIEGKRLGEDIDFPDSVGVIIESPGFIFTKSGFDNLKYLAQIKNLISDNEIRAAMRLLGLDECSKKWVGRYSVGMRQRLGIAQAIMEEPRIIILDEPMNGLDEEGMKLVRKILLDLKARGICILLASHNKEDIDILCDHVYRMVDGRLDKIC